MEHRLEGGGGGRKQVRRENVSAQKAQASILGPSVLERVLIHLKLWEAPVSLYVCVLNLKTWKITPSHLTLKGQCGHPTTALADSKLDSLQMFSLRDSTGISEAAW